MLASFSKSIKYQMNNQELINRLKPIVSNYTQNKEALESINDATDFIKDLKINSANLVDVILDVEEEFDIIIDKIGRAHV